jgi:hypothetical protein
MTHFSIFLFVWPDHTDVCEPCACNKRVIGLQCLQRFFVQVRNQSVEVGALS